MGQVRVLCQIHMPTSGTHVCSDVGGARKWIRFWKGVPKIAWATSRPSGGRCTQFSESIRFSQGGCPKPEFDAIGLIGTCVLMCSSGLVVLVDHKGSVAGRFHLVWLVSYGPDPIPLAQILRNAPHIPPASLALLLRPKCFHWKMVP